MKLIPLTQGQHAKVDDWWYDTLIAMGPWCCCEKRKGLIYATTYTGGGRENATYVLMQNVVKTPKDGEVIDHVNLDSLDNQEHNLRSATHSQQVVNRDVRSDNKTSGVPGVSWDRTAKTWRVYTNKNGKRICIGLRKDLSEAIELRNNSVVAIHGEFARVFDGKGNSVSAKQLER